MLGKPGGVLARRVEVLASTGIDRRAHLRPRSWRDRRCPNGLITLTTTRPEVPQRQHIGPIRPVVRRRKLHAQIVKNGLPPWSGDPQKRLRCSHVRGHLPRRMLILKRLESMHSRAHQRGLGRVRGSPGQVRHRGREDTLILDAGTTRIGRDSGDWIRRRLFGMAGTRDACGFRSMAAAAHSTGPTTPNTASAADRHGRRHHRDPPPALAEELACSAAEPASRGLVTMLELREWPQPGPPSIGWPRA